MTTVKRFESLNGGQFSLSAKLIKPTHLVILSTDILCSTTDSLEAYMLTFLVQLRSRRTLRFSEQLVSVERFATILRQIEPIDLGPVHTYPFSNENGAVLLRFQKDLRPHLSFSYRFRPFTLQRSSREKPHGTVCWPF